MSLWYKKLGFHNNPFSIKPAAFDDELVAYNLDYIYKKVEDGDMLFIEGFYGSGKTTILKNIINEFRGKNKIIYYNFNTGSVDLNKLINGANSFLRRVSGLRVKNIIMLLDEAHTMSSKDAKELLEYYKDGTLLSVIFVTHDYDLMKFPEEYEYYLNGNVMRTIDLSNNEAVDLIRARIGGLDILSDKDIIKLYNLADKNPRRLLAYCEDVVRFAVEIGDDKVSEFHINEILKDVVEEKKPKKIAKKKTAVKKKVTVKKPAKKAKPKPKPKVEKKEPKIKVKAVEEVKPVEEIKPVETKSADDDKKKKFKVNKLVEDSKKRTLGQVVAKEEPAEVEKTTENEEEMPEYKVYFLDDE
jgi:energy-coupling factor transporter ATP-binding protein EcfA2